MAALDRFGVWRREPMSGMLIGLDTAEAVGGMPADLDREFTRRLLMVAESQFVSAVRRRQETEKTQ